MTPDRYRKARKSLGLNQAELAAKLGVRRETIIRRESGSSEITREMALAISTLKPKP